MNHKALDTLITHAFGKSTASKGLAYWRQSRARLLEVDEKYDVMQIRAMVRGSRFNFYEVQLSWSIDNPEMMQGMCSCPMRNDCKHCAATAYLYFSSQPDQRRENSIDGWLSGLRRQRSQAEQTESEDLVVYLLSFAANKQLEVTPVKVRKLKKGGYGQQRKIDLHELRGQYSRATSALDTEIGGLLSAVNNTGNYYTTTTTIQLKGEVGELALKKILLSGRCHLQDKDSDQLKLDSVRQLDLEWHKGKNGWRLHLISQPPLERWVEVKGFWYYDSLESTIGPLQNEIEPATLMEILKIPAIPEDRLADVNRALLDTLPDIILPIPAELDLNVQTIQGISPRPVITLRNQSSDSGTSSYGIELEFEYNGIAISTAHSTPMLRVEQDGVLYQIYRQLEREKDLRQQLETTQLQVQKDNQTYLLPGPTPQSQAEAWEKWLSQSAPELEAQDWTLHVASDFSLNIYTGEQNWQAKISESGNDDWFNLSLGIELEGRSINLLPLLVKALQQAETPQALLKHLEQQPYLLLPLGKEEWLKLPSQRITTIVATLIELYDREAVSDNGDLSLSWYQSLGLEALLNDQDLVWEGADRLKALVEKLRHFNGIEAIPLPTAFGATLRPYQLEGYRWLQFLRDFGFHGILADDMGLGKTVQTLAHLLMEKQSGRADLPSLVIAPTSVVGNWVREASRFAPQLKVKLLYGSERKEEFSSLGHYDLLITTYTLIRQDLEAYLEQSFHLLILDEAQMIKNPQAKTTLAIAELKARHRLALSGTPMENHLAELWSIFHFLMPGFLNSQPRFTRLFRNPIEKEADQTRSEVLRQRIKPFMLRRSKTQVERDLPAKTEIVHFLSLSGSQRDLYETLRVAMDTRIKDEISKKGLKRSQIMLLDALLKLRQVCCDPSLVKLDQARKVKESAKLDFLATTLPELVAEGRRILIFSQFVAVLDLIETLLKKLSIPNLRLTGATRKREEVVDKFQRGEAPIFLISLKAGGVGLNLTAADTVIHYDPWWNPAAENQATDRAWRIGQDKPVFVYKLITEQTIEEKILALQAKKQQLTEGVFSEQEEGSLRIEAEELLALLEA